MSINPLQRGSEYLFRENGWCKGQLRDKKDGQVQYCLVGALNLATRGREEDRLKAKRLALEVLHEQHPELPAPPPSMIGELYPWVSTPRDEEYVIDIFLTRFNDTRRNKEPVIRILQKAAQHWDGF